MKDFVDKQYRGSVPIHCMPSFEPVREDDAFHDIGNQHKLDKGPSLANELYKKDSVRVVDFPSWCSELLVRVLRSRTSFSAYVVKSIRVPRSQKMSTSALFPVPLPHPEAFRRMPPGCSSDRRRKINFNRAINVIVLALNFWWSDGRSTDSFLLGRSLNSCQQSVVARVKKLILADGPGATFSAVSCGRKFPQLIARLSELSECVTRLGVGAGPYSKVFQGLDVEKEVDSPELQPYRSLCADRLLLKGTGSWDATSFLSDELAVVYRYPDVLLLDRTPKKDEYPPFHDDAVEVGKLARLWDSRGLLYIHQIDLPSHVPHEAVRVFNNFKSLECDRQIGDRRGRNAVEARVRGPSSTLPSGVDFTDLWVSPLTSRFSINITDRSDFYHQFLASENRSISNTVFPPLDFEALKDTKAMAAYTFALAHKSRNRLKVGDGLKISSRQQFGKLPSGKYFASYRALFQGDHSGVEVATDAHVGLLQRYGLLKNERRVEADRPFLGGTVLEGLVIDDYFSIGVVPRTPSLICDHPRHGLSALENLEVARKAYEKYGLLGSHHKDVVDSSAEKVVGAWVNSSDQAARQGVATVSSPPGKRLGLSSITLAACQLPYITDVLLVCILGGWTSILGYRRPMMSILNKSYHLVDASLVDADHPKLVPLTRPVCCELVLVSVLCMMASFDVSSGMLGRVFATDASNTHGAIVSASLDPRISWMVSRVCKSKGAYTRILTPSECVLRAFDILDECPEEKDEKLSRGGPSRPLAFHYDFLEVFAGSATVSDAAAALGLTCGPPIDITYSCELDGTYIHIIAWITYMLSSKQLLCVMVMPPCTSFSIMRRPALRDLQNIFGFDVCHIQTRVGNILAQRSFQILYIALANFATALLENPWSSKMKKLPSWRMFDDIPGLQTIRSDSCMFGSIHRKSFAFLGVNAKTSLLERKCDRSHKHVQIQGKFTKASASYTPNLSKALAEVMKEGADRAKAIAAKDTLAVKGLEDQLLNEILISSKWELEDCWAFKAPHHINILELSAVVRLISRLVKERVSGRVIVFVDSNVVRCAGNKGRSSSKALLVLLKKLGALAVSGGLYVTLVYSPTRLNPADDPTRQRPIRSPLAGLCLENWEKDFIARLSIVSKLRRFASNWVRLVIRLLGPSVLFFGDRSLYRSTQRPDFGFALRAPSAPQKGFDATLGYPGEGPYSITLALSLCPHGLFQLSVQLVRFTWTFVCLVSFLCLRSPWVLCWVSLCLLPRASHGAPLQPRNPGDFTRSSQRMLRPPIQSGGPVLEVTTAHRREYFTNFLNWCVGEHINFEELLETYYWHVDEINTILARYGRQLYDAGRPYNHYAETINALTARKPALRRQMQGAWDFAYGWVREEPPSHHRAMPWQILLSLLTIALSWGWLRLAGVMALSWGALLRVGEVCAAIRSDLLLPEDTNFTNAFGLLSIREPKTRYSAARHQSAKLDIGDLLEVVSLAFRNLKREQRLWPHSSQTLRIRFRQVLQAAGLPTTTVAGSRALDPGSLRPGGATWLLQQYESGELVQRRGRWMNYRVMSIYIQEVGAFQYLAELEDKQRQKVLFLAQCFPEILQAVYQLQKAHIPEAIWWKLLFSK